MLGALFEWLRLHRRPAVEPWVVEALSKALAGTVWRHKRTGNLYRIEGAASNATNAQNGQAMLLYRREGEKTVYVREFREFMDKFKDMKTEPYA